MNYDIEKKQRLIIDYLSKLENLPENIIDSLRVYDFPETYKWFNLSATTESTSSLKFSTNLKNKLVVIDFWTYCCINCLHIIQELEQFENKYKNYHELTFIGCHSAKFDNERDSKILLKAILKNDIHHPVINDFDMNIWTNYDIHCWPTLLVVGPRGIPLLCLRDEGYKEVLDLFLSTSLKFYENKELNREILPIMLEKEKIKDEWDQSPISFPGKIIVIDYIKDVQKDDINFPYKIDLLIISDSNNNRICIVDEDTKQLVEIIGSGKVGFIDGISNECSFNSPQGILFTIIDKIPYLYICDTKNHAIREYSFFDRKVRTVAGCGRKGFDFGAGKSGSDQIMASPWDIEYDGNSLVVAMAGSHQIWNVHPKTVNVYSKYFFNEFLGLMYCIEW